MKNPIALLAALLLAGCASPPPPPTAPLSDVPPLVMQKAKKEKQTWIDSAWHGAGQVVVGRLRRQDPADSTPIVARTKVRDDGWFAAALYPSRKLSFRAHGSEPVDLAPAGTQPIVRLPDAVLKRVPPAETAEIRGRIICPGQSPTATVKLVVAPAPLLWEDSGYESAARFTALVASQQVPAGREFAFSGMSPIEYELHISAPGCITLKRTVVPDRRAHLSLGDIELIPAPLLVFDYVAQFKTLAQARSFPERHQAIECNGTNRFRFTNERDELGNALFLRLTPGTDPDAARIAAAQPPSPAHAPATPVPAPGQVRADFWFSPAPIYDLGKISLVEIIASANDALLRPAPHAPDHVILQPGHTYFFECTNKNANCLFSVNPAK